MAASDWPERTRMWITVGVAAGVNILLGAGLYMVHGDWKKLEQAYQKKEKERLALKDLVEKEGPELEHKLQSLTDSIADMKRKLPKQENSPELIAKIAELQQTTHCTQQSSIYSPGGPVAGAGAMSISQEIWKTRWTGDLPSFCKLMNTLEEHFDRFIALENLVIAPQNSGLVQMGTPLAVEEFSVDIVTYRYTGQ
ncbi:MAG: hypothetical protein ABSE73_19885 [Planctomycetota bacterium]